MALVNLLQQIDLSVLFFINHQLANPVLDFIFKAVHYLSYPILGLLIFYFILKKERFIATLLITVVIISTVTSALVKAAVPRERPYQVLDVRQLVEEDDNRSFPSNHAQLSFALSAIVLYFYRRFGSILILLSLLMGASRIYLGVHYPSDVIGGALIGCLLAFLVLKINLILKKEFSHNKR